MFLNVAWREWEKITKVIYPQSYKYSYPETHQKRPFPMCFSVTGAEVFTREGPTNRASKVSVGVIQLGKPSRVRLTRIDRIVTVDRAEFERAVAKATSPDVKRAIEDGIQKFKAEHPLIDTLTEATIENLALRMDTASQSIHKLPPIKSYTIYQNMLEKYREIDWIMQQLAKRLKYLQNWYQDVMSWSEHNEVRREIESMVYYHTLSPAKIRLDEFKFALDYAMFSLDYSIPEYDLEDGEIDPKKLNDLNKSLEPSAKRRKITLGDRGVAT
jgi:hypothetical protein